jgi:O-acetyl-ADP-ribose deacetylase (regulator of RNase III)
MKAQIDNSVLELVEGDITKQKVDAVVNAANSGLRGGGGVDGAIHRAGGPEIMAECRRIGGCPPGSAVITTGGHLPARYVIHTVGPIWYGGSQGEPDLLARAYRSSLRVAEEHTLKTIAFPSLSTGAYGYPIREAATIALSTILSHLKGPTGLEHVIFVLFGMSAFEAYTQTLEDLMQQNETLHQV